MPDFEQKKEKTLCLWAFSSSQYKYTTFSAEIQIVLTFEYNSGNVKKTRFAAARVWQVLYYEAHMWVGFTRRGKKGCRYDEDNVHHL